MKRKILCVFLLSILLPTLALGGQASGFMGGKYEGGALFFIAGIQGDSAGVEFQLGGAVVGEILLIEYGASVLSVVPLGGALASI